MKRLAFYSLGWSSLLLGLLGVFLPLLPTTPFVLLSAFCFARSSPRCYQWLLAHPWFGPLIYDWQQYGAIAAKTKIIATASMLLVGSYPIYVLPWWGKVLVISIFTLVLIFIWTRPDRPNLQS